MEFILTDHAEKRLKQRRISLEWIERALSFPARTENDFTDPTLAHALLAIPEKGFRVLRVVYNESADPVRVVTAFFDDEVAL